uniref:Uncharacterized protein n=1 Tax=Utricularia reniformis TaxID=192314 RepID=A0A1Y0B3Z2_9LAMI|nr:hypothetical protein AEK19_MT1880 [Utricularia reniformis]ART32049.1 hypothetical protein AEK19_MT1880 [Utricularia reniformis]
MERTLKSLSKESKTKYVYHSSELHQPLLCPF